MSDNITLPREVVQFVLKHLEWWSDDEPQEKEAIEALRKALAAEQPKHPGYIIGSHWLETAYSRICAGEAEEEVLRDCGWRRCAVGQGLTQHCAEAEALRRDAERLREEVRVLRLYGNKDCTAMADEAMKEAALRREETT